MKQKRSPYIKRYNKWRIRILYSIIIGYASFYFCRQNFNIAMPIFTEYFNVTRTDLGWFLATASIVYGTGKLVNGIISDKSNARIFIFIGLAASSVITILSGFTEKITVIGILWILNHWFQSMGWPAIARMLSYWFSPKELGTKWSFGATSHQIGGALTMLVCGYLVENYSWRSAFIVPGIISFIIALFLFNRLRDSPADVDLPPVEEYKEDEIKSNAYIKLSTKELFKIVFLNKFMWYICISNMCLYIVRMGIIFWAPMFLKELKNLTLSHAGLQVAAYEVCGLAGAICAGIVSDRLFKGQRGPVGFIFMIFLALVLVIFWLLPSNKYLLGLCVMSLAGFFVYGPQVLIGVASADLTNKNAIGTANGLVSLFANAGSAMAGICVGVLTDNFGWNGAFIFFIIASIIGGVFFLMTWQPKKLIR